MDTTHKLGGEALKRSRDVLERLYHKYNRREFICTDPLCFVYRYSRPEDMEIAAFLASALAYGRVTQIKNSLNRLFECMGDNPYCFVKDLGRARQAKLNGFRHRFTTGRDILALLELFRRVFEEYGSIEHFFLRGYKLHFPKSEKLGDEL